MQFLYERVNSNPVPATAIDTYTNIIFVSEHYYDIVAARIAESVLRGEYRWCISHPLLQNEPFAKRVLEDPNVKQWVKTTDFPSPDCDDKHLIYWAVLSKSEYIVRTVIQLTDHIFSEREIKSALDASILSGSMAVMEVLFTAFEDRIPQNTVSELFLDAAEREHIEMVTFLLQKGADITKTNEDKDNIFHVAARRNNIGIVDVALVYTEQRILVNSRNKNGTTPIMEAALTGFMSVFSRLFEHKADLTLLDDEDEGVLHYASRGGNTSIVQHLIPVCDINKRRRDGRTPVMHAAVCGQKDVFDLLVSSAADLTLVDDEDGGVLHYACQGGNASIVQHLIRICDINKRRRDGQTPVMLAAVCGQKDVFDLLVSNAADLTLVDDKDDGVLHYACQGGNTSIVQHLIRVCDINKRGRDGQTPVMRAALCGQKDVFDLLVSNAADLTLVDDEDGGVLHYACQGGNTSIVQHLIRVCDINKRRRYGQTPVMVAALCGQKDVFDLLVSNAADLTLVDDVDGGVLHYACQGGNASIVQHLIRICDINKRRRDGQTPVMRAALYGQKDVLTYWCPMQLISPWLMTKMAECYIMLVKVVTRLLFNTSSEFVILTREGVMVGPQSCWQLCVVKKTFLTYWCPMQLISPWLMTKMAVCYIMLVKVVTRLLFNTSSEFVILTREGVMVGPQSCWQLCVVKKTFLTYWCPMQLISPWLMIKMAECYIMLVKVSRWKRVYCSTPHQSL
ncbi:ankyrin-1-like [Haliotis rubra]|uniref:ankyrin-1-like n=1 Tax=Haliotis rubra TaxID=36100 RepID=UPI001EE57A69|nr:ankyrin-1-like [Haliotis rubra]